MKSQRAFGEALRRHREKAGVSLEAIALQTKVSPSLFAALERGDCSRWPAGIYSRSYIRDYAHAIGLDPDDVATQFAGCFTGVAFPEGAPEVAVKAPPPEMPPEPLRMVLEAEPNAALGTVARRAAFIVLDLMLILSIGSAVWMTITPSFWTAAGAAAIGLHVLTLAAGGRPAASLLDISNRAAHTRTTTDPSDAAVVEPA